MTTPDPEQIAAGLNEAQREALCGISGDGRTGGGKAEWQNRRWVLKAMPKLVDSYYHRDCMRWKLTPLGLAVRNILKGSPND